jgi:hypothetical protein
MLHIMNLFHLECLSTPGSSFRLKKKKKNSRASVGEGCSM